MFRTIALKDPPLVKLEDLQSDATVRGILPDAAVTVVSVSCMSVADLLRTPAVRSFLALFRRHSQPSKVSGLAGPWGSRSVVSPLRVYSSAAGAGFRCARARHPRRQRRRPGAARLPRARSTLGLCCVRELGKRKSHQKVTRKTEILRDRQGVVAQYLLFSRRNSRWLACRTGRSRHEWHLSAGTNPECRGSQRSSSNARTYASLGGTAFPMSVM